uniref:Conserved secreted protein n=1 Tax=Oncopeltus fasciatus TaxID=7536 RepID=A3FK52_ONCFA|nr:conserved secreted protein [Oncopeltus fasciatus]
MYLVVLLAVTGWISLVTCYPKTACGDGPSHNLLLGNRTYGDKLLYSGSEHIDSSLLRVKTKDVHWPLHGVSPEVITRLEVVDKAKDGSGGCAFLSGGGPGSRVAKLHLKTQRGGSD